MFASEQNQAIFIPKNRLLTKDRFREQEIDKDGSHYVELHVVRQIPGFRVADLISFPRNQVVDVQHVSPPIFLAGLVEHVHYCYYEWSFHPLSE